jgi:kynureninase
MRYDSTDISVAKELDANDELDHFRDEFVIEDPNLVYLDGNSLGRLPKRTVGTMHEAISDQWGQRLIRVWGDGWIKMPQTLGAKIARLVGAQEDEVLVTDATSINLFKLAVAAVRARPGRTKIISDELNFPSDLYVLQGVCDLLDMDHRLELVPSRDGVSISSEAVEAAINEDTALVSLSHVAFKSAFMYDMKGVTELAHGAGALTLWDLSHSAGAVKVDLNGSKADLAVGCTYKYLNAGPGAPAFLYVRKDLQAQLQPPIWGWFASQTPFAFDLNFNPTIDISRYQVGTPPMLSLKAIEPGIDILLAAGIERLREKSVKQTEYLVYLAENWLYRFGFKLGSPREAALRGSHISLRHPEGYRINRALIESPAPAVRVIPDFREPDNIRLGIAPVYTRYIDIYRALKRMREIVEKKEYEGYSKQRQTVT